VSYQYGCIIKQKNREGPILKDNGLQFLSNQRIPIHKNNTSKVSTFVSFNKYNPSIISMPCTQPTLLFKFLCCSTISLPNFFYFYVFHFPQKVHLNSSVRSFIHNIQIYAYIKESKKKKKYIYIYIYIYIYLYIYIFFFYKY